MKGYGRPCMAMQGHVGLRTAIYGYARCTALQGNVRLCRVMIYAGLRTRHVRICNQYDRSNLSDCQYHTPRYLTLWDCCKIW